MATTAWSAIAMATGMLLLRVLIHGWRCKNAAGWRSQGLVVALWRGLVLMTADY